LGSGTGQASSKIQFMDPLDGISQYLCRIISPH